MPFQNGVGNLRKSCNPFVTHYSDSDKWVTDDVLALCEPLSLFPESSVFFPGALAFQREGEKMWSAEESIVA